MPQWSKFTDDEIVLIKLKMNVKFEKAMVITLLLSPIICLVMPYISGRRGRGAMIDRMPYWDAVLQMSIIWILALIGVWVLNYFRSNNQYTQIRRFLEKKYLEGYVTGKSKGLFKSFENHIETSLDDEFSRIELEKYESTNFRVGDKFELAFEEKTKTVLKITKMNE